MYTLSSFLWVVSMAAFVFLWWKKRKSRLAAGENYQSDEKYTHISKLKRKVGISCIVLYLMTMFFQPDAPSNNQINKGVQSDAANTSSPNAQPGVMIVKSSFTPPDSECKKHKNATLIVHRCGFCNMDVTVFAYDDYPYPPEKYANAQCPKATDGVNHLFSPHRMKVWFGGREDGRTEWYLAQDNQY